MIDPRHRQPHWNATRRQSLLVVAILSGILAIIPLLSEELDMYRILGFPLGYFLMTNGSIITLVSLLFWHSSRQDRIDRQYGASENI